ncbi:MAG: signal peptidase I [Blautia sp.]|nr:signal peptidase I [Blautia sp.]
MKIWQTIWEYVKLILIVAVSVIVIDGVILINAKIPSASMENTIMTKDRIFGLRVAYGINLDFFGKDLITKKMRDPERYDIVIFRYPDNEKELFIKRIIGLPGDEIEIRDGKVYANGEELEDSFIREPEAGTYDNPRHTGVYKVPEGCYFMLGDNRNNSKDSRFWENTYVTFDQIVGKALFRYFPRPKIFRSPKISE